MKVLVTLSILLVALTACASSEAPAGDEPPTPEQRTPVGPVSTDDTPPESAAAGVMFGRNDDGTFFHGAAGAPVTFVDYSDFL
jgi:hypothetical protein